MSYQVMPEKDPNNTNDPYYVVWCSLETGLNDGSAHDTGELQGETIATVEWTVPAGITRASDVKTAVTIKGVTYAANTVCTIYLSGGTVDTDYQLLCRITTNGSPARGLDKTIIVPVRSQ
jgi:hypothetical protein